MKPLEACKWGPSGGLKSFRRFILVLVKPIPMQAETDNRLLYQPENNGILPVSTCPSNHGFVSIISLVSATTVKAFYISKIFPRRVNCQCHGEENVSAIQPTLSTGKVSGKYFDIMYKQVW